MNKIVCTGGGTAGHVTPNLAIISKLQKLGWDIHYIGSASGIEKTIIEPTGIPFYPVASGKLRRYLDLKNLVDPFRVVKGVFDAITWLRRIKPQVVFSKGGFVAVPVVVASWICRIPVVIHESDFTPGLANRLCTPFARNVCVTFQETMDHVPQHKALWTGLPIREHLALGNKVTGMKTYNFHAAKPVLLVMGGSLGSVTINRFMREALDALTAKFQVIHICGKGNIDPQLASKQGYLQFEYVDTQLPDLMAMADLVVTRSGSTSIFECLALHKPMLLIPLSLTASRGDQLLNASSFQKAGFADVLFEEQVTSQKLLTHIQQLYARRAQVKRVMQQTSRSQATDTIVELLEHIVNK